MAPGDSSDFECFVVPRLGVVQWVAFSAVFASIVRACSVGAGSQVVIACAALEITRLRA